MDDFNIPIMRPYVAHSDSYKEYLHRIDQSQWYTNFGPLVVELEDRLGKLFQSHVITTASCTTGITAALLAMDLPRGSVVLMPSWTFVATASAVYGAGLRPCFVDVSTDTWTVTPKMLRDKITRDTSAVVVVSAFGAPLNMDEWEQFQVETGVKVVVDAAGGFDAFSQRKRQSGIPVCISTHATKCFGTGEGGFVITTNESLAKAIREVTNNGICADRVIRRIGLNAKMSEYHAAIGLAELDNWPVKKQRWFELRGAYVEAFNGTGLTSPTMDASWVGSLMCVWLGRPIVTEVMDKMASAGISTRRVWNRGCHNEPAFKNTPKYDLPVTDTLADGVIFLPYFIGLNKIDYIRDSLLGIIEER